MGSEGSGSEVWVRVWLSYRSHPLCEWVFTYVKGHMSVNWTASQYNGPASGERRAWLHVNGLRVRSAERVRQKAVIVHTALKARCIDK